MLKSAKEEIKRLRSENTLMATRLQMFDDMMTVFNAHKMQRVDGMSPDIVYDIEKAIAEFDGGGKDRQFKQTETAIGVFEEGSIGHRNFERVNSSDDK